MRIFVGYLALKTPEEELAQLVELYGEVERLDHHGPGDRSLAWLWLRHNAGRHNGSDRHCRAPGHEPEGPDVDDA